MFAYINGILEYVSEDNCVLDVQGMVIILRFQEKQPQGFRGLGSR